MIVTIQHVRQAKMCSKGTREFFERHNLDWNKFVKEGLPEEQFLATNDAMAAQVVRIANAQ